MSFETPDRPFRPDVVVEEAGDLGGGHALRLDQVQDDAGVELAGAGAHREAVEGGEAHRALDAHAVGHRAHRGAAAEVGDDDAAAGDLGRDLAQAAGDVFVGEAVEAVAADALVVEGARQGVAVGVVGAGAVEGGVEAGDLRHVRARSPSRGGSARGCSAGAAAPAGTRASSRARMSASTSTGRSKSGPPWTTRWPMASTSRPPWVWNQARVASTAVGRSRTSVGELIDEGGAGRVGGAQPGMHADAVHLAADPPLRGAVDDVEELELQARRAGIDDEQRLHQACTAAAAFVRRELA